MADKMYQYDNLASKTLFWFSVMMSDFLKTPMPLS